MQILSSLNAGKNVLINSINTSHKKQIKLLGLGINSGVEVLIMRNRGGDMVIALGNSRISIGKTIASSIKVLTI